MPEPSPSELPVSPHAFHILLSLADRPRHGYGILLEVEARSEGQMRLGTGTLYSIIKRLRSDGWIADAEAPVEADDDARRKHYRLTDLGRAALTAEAERLQGMVRQAMDKSVLRDVAVE